MHACVQQAGGHKDTYLSMSVGMCIGMCVYMCIGMCVEMCIHMCGWCAWQPGEADVAAAKFAIVGYHDALRTELLQATLDPRPQKLDARL